MITMPEEIRERKKEEEVPGIHFPIIRIKTSRKKANKEFKTFLKNIKKSRQRWEILLKDY